LSRTNAREAAFARPRLSRSTGALLENNGWDICHVSQIGMSRASGADILLALGTISEFA
jgi:hypothetical protein